MGRTSARAPIAAAIAALLLLLLAASAPARSTAAAGDGAKASIIGGHPASIADYPWLAYVQFSSRRGSGFACTGSVVAPRLVLTAGHCVESLETGGILPADGYKVATGVANVADVTPANVTRVVRVLANPSFNASRIQNDAGLLQLADPVAAPALALAGSGQAVPAGTRIEIAGWGLTSPTKRRGPHVLQAAEATLRPAGFCTQRTRLFYPFYSPASQLCTLSPPPASARTCHGDSGGPAIARREDGSAVEVGITSLGEDSCGSAFPVVFARVDRVSAWVDQWIAAIEAGGPLPEVVIPPVHLPYLPLPIAKLLVKASLRERFGNRFRHGRGKQLSCRRIAREKVKCSVSWFQGRDDFYGTITIFLLSSRSEVVWDDRYRIHRVNDRCRFRSGHRRSCRIHTVRR